MTRDRIRHGACAAAVVAALGGAARAQSLHQLGFLGDSPSIANGVSADGRVAVGFSNSPDGFRAFRWTASGGMQSLGAFANPDDYTSSEALAASADGSVIVGVSIRPNSLNEDGSPFRWTAATGLQYLGTLGGSEGGWPYACTPDASVIAGSVCTPSFNYGAVKWASPGAPVALATVPTQTWAGANAVSADGQVFGGWVKTPNHFYSDPAVWTAGGETVTVLPVLATNTVGSVLGMTPDGGVFVGASAGRAVRWVNGGVYEVGTIPGGHPSTMSLATGISADGNTIVGLTDYDANTSFGTAFIWDPVNGMRDLNVVADAAGINRNGFQMFYARGVSADGKVIVGYGFSATAQEAFLLDLHAGAGSCYANCDRSVAAPALNVQDFSCFLQKFSHGDAYANCDGSAVAPVLNVQDFSCFLQKFAAGCP